VKETAALLFDFGGTLDAAGVPWKERFSRHYREEGMSIPADRFDPAFYAAADSMEGALPPGLNLTETVGELSRRLAENLGEELGSLAPRIAVRFLAEASPHLRESARLLADLSSRYRLGIVSNFYGNLASVCREAGLLDSLVVAVDSTVAGFKKPDPRIFALALDALKVTPREAVFVGDSRPRDMAGARAIGMPHVLLSPENNGAEPCCPGDRVIGRLAELKEIFS
jgi:putative hydrolase of the HAD superfamily